MKSLEIPNIPDDVYAETERLARVRGVSVSEVATAVISNALVGETASAVEARLMAEVRAERDAMKAKGVFLTDEFLDEAKKWGREG